MVGAVRHCELCTVSTHGNLASTCFLRLNQQFNQGCSTIPPPPFIPRARHRASRRRENAGCFRDDAAVRHRRCQLGDGACTEATSRKPSREPDEIEVAIDAVLWPPVVSQPASASGTAPRCSHPWHAATRDAREWGADERARHPLPGGTTSILSVARNFSRSAASLSHRRRAERKGGIGRGCLHACGLWAEVGRSRMRDVIRTNRAVGCPQWRRDHVAEGSCARHG